MGVTYVQQGNYKVSAKPFYIAISPQKIEAAE